MTTIIMTKLIRERYETGMGLTEELKSAIEQALEANKYESPSELARKSGAQQASLWRFLKDQTGLSLSSAAKLIEELGGKLVFPGQSQPLAREICWVDAQIVPAGQGAKKPEAEDYFAVPLVGEAGAGPGVVSEEAVKSWVMVYRHQRAIRGHSDLLAVEIERHSRSMVPTLHPRDIVLVDRRKGDPIVSGGIYLVREPGQEGGGKVKRVTLTTRKNETLVVYYSDNQDENPPEVYSLQADFNDRLDDAIIGRVVWAWSDMTRK